MLSVIRTPRPDALFPVRAGELLAEGKSKQALELCRHGLIYYPENPSGYTMLANAFLALGERERAYLVLVDGYRRTRSESLRHLAGELATASSRFSPVRPASLPLVDDPEVVMEAGPTEERANIKVASVEEEESVVEEKAPGEEGEQQPRMGIELAPDEKGDDRAESAPRLALHVTRPPAGTRSSNLRLIPGLEFAPLRHEDPVSRPLIASLMHGPISNDDLLFSQPSSAPPTPPPFPDMEEEAATATAETGGSDEFQLPVSDSLTQVISELTGSASALPRNPARLHELAREEEGGLTPLEELARRLETARIPVIDEGDARAVFEPSIVSDTLAEILVQQKAYTEAIKAFQTLARIKPEKLDYYQEKIEEMKFLLTQPGSDRNSEEEE